MGTSLARLRKVLIHLVITSCTDVTEVLSSRGGLNVTLFCSNSNLMVRIGTVSFCKNKDYENNLRMMPQIVELDSQFLSLHNHHRNLTLF